MQIYSAKCSAFSVMFLLGYQYRALQSSNFFKNAMFLYLSIVFMVGCHDKLCGRLSSTKHSGIFKFLMIQKNYGEYLLHPRHQMYFSHCLPRFYFL